MNVPAEQVGVLVALTSDLPSDAYLAGGVAVAAHIGHRQSRDLDIFTTTSPPEALAPRLSKHPDLLITSRAPGTLYLEVSGVPVSIIEHAYPLISAPEHLAGIPFPVAGVRDLTAMKLHAIASRGAARDFWDLHALLAHRGIALSEALSDHQARYPREDLGHVVRSLAYFGDAENGPLPLGLGPSTWTSLRKDFEAWVHHL